VEFGSDDWMDADNPDTNGYDDYFMVEGEEAEMRRAALEGVQCENCHGPMGPEFNSHQPIVNFATIGTHDPENVQAEDFISTCYPCHVTQFEGPGDDFDGGYGVSGHASAAGGDLEAFNEEHYAHGSCGACHSNEGFIVANDPAYANAEFEHVNFIGCVTCHDPHMGEDSGGNPAQLRNVGPSTLAYTYPWEADDPEAPTMEGYGNAQLCAQCHKGRRNNSNVAGQIANGYAHFGPHSSAQTDMFIGYGSYEIPGSDYDHTHAHQSIPTACVQCHMVRETEIHGGVEDVAFHNFRPDLGTNCSGCHPGIDEAFLDGFQAEIEGCLLYTSPSPRDRQKSRMPSSA
jgi:formate-dependent nitrite reductase cytochrome c552 subunit